MAADPKQVKAIFLDAAEMPAAGRAAFLDAACAGDMALRGRVEQLLRAQAEGSRFLHAPADNQDADGGMLDGEGEKPLRARSELGSVHEAPPAPDKPRPSLMPLFDKALDIASPAEREAYLAAACAGAPELRQQVDALLEAYENAAGQVSTLDTPILEGPGTVIGLYKLQEQIGQGGFGVVFMAEQKEPIRRKVALKVVKPGMDTKEVIARFEAERQALALMDHPNIAKVLDAGQTSTGRPYFVMDLVKGVPITEFCDESQLTLKERLELFVNVCKAVQHAHQKGIIHRDIKPSNVLVTMQDGVPLVKVIDFGIAKALGQQLTDKTFFTGFAQMIGTPLYMSPEQAALSNVDVDTRSDIYSLGVLLYELLTGTTPVDRKRLHQAAFDEIRRIIREEEPPKPSTRMSTLGQEGSIVSAQRRSDPRRLSQLFRGELDWIVMKALDKDRNRRFETATGFAEDIQRYLADEPVLAGRPSAVHRLRKFVRRHRGALLVALVIAVVVATLVGGIGWVIRDRAARDTEITSQVQFVMAAAQTLLDQNQPAQARHKVDEATRLIGKNRAALPGLAREVDAFKVELDRWQRFIDLIDKAHQGEGRIGSRKQPAWSVLLLDALTCYEVLDREDWSTRLEQSVLGKRQVEQVRRAVYEQLLLLANDLAPAVPRFAWGSQVFIRGTGSLTPELAARRALVYLAAAEKAHPATVSLYKIRANCHKLLGNEEGARADQELARQVPPAMAIDHFMRGKAAYEFMLGQEFAKHRAEAIGEFEAGIRLEPMHYRGMMMLGDCLMNFRPGLLSVAPWSDNPREALWVYTNCITLRPEYGQAYDHRARAYWLLGRFKEAVEDYSKAIELHLEDAFSWYGRALSYQKLGQWNKALDDLSKSIELGAGEKRNDRAIVYKKLGQWDNALADYTKLIGIYPKAGEFLLDRGMLYGELGQWDKALDDYSAAIKQGPSFTDLTRAFLHLALAHAHLGQKEEALKDISQARVLGKDPFTWSILFDFANPNLDIWEMALGELTTGMESEPKDPGYPQLLSYLLATHPDPKFRDPHRALELAKKAKANALDPKDKYGMYGSTLGIAHYRVGDWQAAVVVLENSSEDLKQKGSSPDGMFFLAMAHWQLGHKDRARHLYNQAVIQMNAQRDVGERRRFRAEAAELLGIPETQ